MKGLNSIFDKPTLPVFSKSLLANVNILFKWHVSKKGINIQASHKK